MKKYAVKMVLAINAATNGQCYMSIEHEVKKISNMDKDALTVKIRQLQSLFRLVTTLPRLSFLPDNEWVNFVRGRVNEKRREWAV